MVTDHLGWNLSKAERLIVVGTHEVLGNSANFADFPSSPNTLYELTKVPKDRLLEAIAAGDVHPDMLGSDASALARRAKARDAASERMAPDPGVVDSPPPGFEIRCANAAQSRSYKNVIADLAVFSPPYFVGVDYDGADDTMSREEWAELLRSAAGHLVDIAGVARIVVNFPMGVDRRPYTPLLPVVLAALGDVAAPEAVIVWDKATTGNRTSWGSWRSPTDPAIRDRTELIAVFRTENQVRCPQAALELDEGGRRVSPWLSAGRFTELTQDLWTFAPARRDGSHPTPFPVELPRRVLQLYGWPGCTVVDPFAGSGTTGVAALGLGANAVLIDVSAAYCQVAGRRLQAAETGAVA